MLETYLFALPVDFTFVFVSVILYLRTLCLLGGCLFHSYFFFSLMIWHCFGSPKYRSDYMQRPSVSSAPANVTENLWYLFIFNRNIRFITQGLGTHWWGCLMALCQLFGLVVRCTPSYRWYSSGKIHCYNIDWIFTAVYLRRILLAHPIPESCTQSDSRKLYLIYRACESVSFEIGDEKNLHTYTCVQWCDHAKLRTI